MKFESKYIFNEMNLKTSVNGRHFVPGKMYYDSSLESLVYYCDTIYITTTNDELTNGYVNTSVSVNKCSVLVGVFIMCSE